MHAHAPAPCARLTILIYCIIMICLCIWWIADGIVVLGHAHYAGVFVASLFLTGICGLARCIIGLIGAIKYSVCLLLVFFWWTVVALIIFFVLCIIVVAQGFGGPGTYVSVVICIIDIVIAILTWTLKEDIRTGFHGGLII